jgi:two-component system response regulator GlrR
VRVDAAWLRVGARILVGDSELRVEALDQPTPLAERPTFAGLASKSPAMMRLFDLLARAAGSDVTVLMQGPTGTGKDVLARALHKESARRDGPFCVVDCGSLAPSLVQGELFGHKKGAFTGADVDRAGVFEAARGGTVFLDEVGELPLDLQPALLRVLENREVKRLGESHARAVDVRVIAATHRDLPTRVAEGQFREDLYFRLAVVRARVPSLAERRADVGLLTSGILADLGYGGALPPGALAKLEARAWPGNVRELKNVLQAAVALAGGGPLQLDEVLPAELVAVDAGAAAGRLREERGRNERQFLESLLHKHQGNVSAAAREAGIDRKHLHRLIARHEIDVDRYRPS